MEIILYIILGFIVLGIAIVLLRFVALIAGPALLLGGLSWLIFDSFWPGCILGGLITLIGIIRDPSGFFDDAFDEATTPINSTSSSTPRSSGKTIRDKWGNTRDITYEDADSITDDYGNNYRKGSDGNWYQID